MKNQPHRSLWPALALLLGAVITGCDTTTVTTLEENRGAYQDAREFLRVNRTNQQQVQSKYGKPNKITPYEKGTVWTYSRTQAVLVNAYTNTPYGTEGGVMGHFGGFERTVMRTTLLELFFDPDGVLTHYRIYRDAP
jgi:hypothetical protein